MRVCSVGALVARAAARSAGSGSRPSLVARRVELPLGALGVVARLLRADLAARDLLAALLEPRPARCVSSRRALAQLGGQLLARRTVGRELGLEHLDAGARRRRRRPRSACGQPLGGGLERLVAGQPAPLVLEPPRALGALALGALGEPLLGGERGLDLGARARRSAPRRAPRGAAG